MSYEEVLFAKEDGVATITLNRPEQLNAFSPRMLTDLQAALGEINDDDAVRVAVITGAGRAFSSGGNVKTMIERHEQKSPTESARELRNTLQRIPLAMRKLTKPVIAAVNGPATGGGCDLALMCDIRVASENARFAESYVKLGLIPGAGGAYLLPRAVGLSKALELLYTGDIVDAQEAARIGLVSKVVAANELLPTARALAIKIANNPPLAVRQIREAVYLGQETSLEALLAHVSLAIGALSKTADHLEAVHAFIEKRLPRFIGR